MKRQFIITCWIALLPLLSQSQSYQFSLAEAQAYAVENSYTMQYALMDQATAEKDVKLTAAIGLPQVNASLDYNNYIDIPTQVAPADAFGFPAYLTTFLANVSQETGVEINAPEVDPDAVSELQFGAPQTMTAGVNASQLIFDGSYFVGKRAAKAYADLMQKNVSKNETGVKAQVADSYHMVLVARQNVSILEDSKSLVESTVQEATVLFNSGFAEEQDLDQLQLTLADLNARINFASKQADIALDLLKFNLGLPLVSTLELTDNVETLLADGMDPLGVPFSLNDNPDIRVQQGYVGLSELNVKNEQAKRLPSISAFYTYQRNAQRDDFSFLDFDQKWYPTQLWGVQMSMPIFGGFSKTHSIAKAKIDQERATLTLKQMSAGAELEYATALNEYANSVENERIQAEALQLAERIFSRTQIKYGEGLASSFDLAQAQNQLLTAQGNKIQSILQLLNAKTRLNKSLNNF